MPEPKSGRKEIFTNKKPVDCNAATIEDDGMETEVAFPKSHFNAILQARDDRYAACLNDATMYAGKLKLERYKLQAYEKSMQEGKYKLEKQKQENTSFKNKVVELENQMALLRSKKKVSLEQIAALEKDKSKSENISNIIEAKSQAYYDENKHVVDQVIENLKNYWD
jgi:chromosome segregation ATPase